MERERSLSEELAESERRKSEVRKKIGDYEDRLRVLKRQPKMEAIDILIRQLEGDLEELKNEASKF